MSLSTHVSALTAGRLSSRSLSCFYICLTLHLGDVHMGVYPGQLVVLSVSEVRVGLWPG